MNRILSVGWFDNAPFKQILSARIHRIKEVFFAWPGVLSSRPMSPWTDERKALIIDDLKWARSNAIELDAVFNANCYGDIAMTETLADQVKTAFAAMDAYGLMPEHITTASPFIATVVKRTFPAVKIRFSVNMDINTIDALEYVDDICDGFYVGRNKHRRLDYVEKMSAWAKSRSKLIGILANPGCLRNCTFHTFHDNLHGHNRIGQSAAAEKFKFTNFLCRSVYERGEYERFLRSIWLRPEDLPMYEPYVDVVKLATRRHPDPEAVIQAYADCRYDGDLAKIVDPCFSFPGIFDNRSLGESPLWPEVRDCLSADNCCRCGKCAELMKSVYKMRDREVDFGSKFKEFFKG